MENMVSPEKHEVKKLNQWLIALCAITILYIVMVILYYNAKPTTSDTISVVTNGTVESYYIPSISSNIPINKPLLEKRNSYELYQYVVVNGFCISGLIIQIQGDVYTVMYEDKNGDLQKVDIAKEMISVPSREDINQFLPLNR